MRFSRARNAHARVYTHVCACVRVIHNHITSLPVYITICFNYEKPVMSRVMSGYAARCWLANAGQCTGKNEYKQGVK